MSTNDAWEKFKERFEVVADNVAENSKRLRALKTFSERVPQEEQDKLPEMVIFVPDEFSYGGVRLHVEHFMIYLPFGLEGWKQVEISEMVAHEFAHVLLGKDGNCEKAEKLVAKWGYWDKKKHHSAQREAAA